VTINARPGIPPGIGLKGVVCPDGNDIFPGPEIRGQGIYEADISIGTFAEGMAIDPNFTVHVYAVETDMDVLASGCGG
jgi:hypothetical protein